ncbi:hypothetical protein [Rhodoferax sp.]|uniref:hypothetical protein n=1 Tax=Rhodoferax sp. TaxID=50421 RepID=UPI0027259852|nr:hypothetical protein [Rhodoferax sp.]MDO9199142.1 hypothetical protein [Rhodoferax sp.]
MTTQDIFAHNLVILTHFDSYSTALLFPRWDKTLLWPEALPASASPMPAPVDIGPEYAGDAVRLAVVERCGLNPDELVHVKDFNHWAQTATGPVRIHLLRFTTLDAPKEAIEALGGVFKPISELRGSAMSELVLLREVFNRIVGAGGG